MKRWAVLGLVLLTLTACSSGGVDSESSPTGDAGAFLACTHFRDVAQDVADGVLTDSEIRTKLQEVYHDAQVSEEPGVAEGARGMLADVTSGDYSQFEAHIDGFSQACENAGF